VTGARLCGGSPRRRLRHLPHRRFPALNHFRKREHRRPRPAPCCGRAPLFPTVHGFSGRPNVSQAMAGCRLAPRPTGAERLCAAALVSGRQICAILRPLRPLMRPARPSRAIGTRPPAGPRPGRKPVSPFDFEPPNRRRGRGKGKAPSSPGLSRNSPSTGALLHGRPIASSSTMHGTSRSRMH